MKKDEKIRTYRGIVPFARIAAPVFKLLYYVFGAAILLCGILALIILLVNTSVEDIMLPPLMSLHGKEYYSIFIGNGIRIDAPYDSVSLEDIKTVLYAELLLAAAACCLMTPVSLYLSGLLKNIASGKALHPKNARYVMYIGLSVMIGYTFVRIASRFYNYMLVKTFVSDSEAIHLSLGFDGGGLLIGCLLILLGWAFGYAAAHPSGPESALPAEKNPDKL